MQHLELLISLPSSLSCIVLRDWLSLKSVMALDSAYCNYSHRKVIADLLKSNEYWIREQVTISGNYVLSLLKRFGQKIRRIEFVERVSQNQENLVKAYCYDLKHVRCFGEMTCTPALWSLLRAYPTIESLTLRKKPQQFMEHFFSPPLLRPAYNLLLPKLSTLVITGFEITDENLFVDMPIDKLVRLDLSGCRVAGTVFSQIARACPELRALTLSNVFVPYINFNPIIDQTLSEFTRICTHIVQLDISDSLYITDAGILSVVQNLTGLQRLNITNISQLTENSLEHIYTHCHSTLQTILFNSCTYEQPSFCAQAVNTFLERCTKLRTVYFGDHSKVRPKTSMLSPAAICNLTHLAISGRVATEQNLITISSYGVNLEVLIVDEYIKYTREMLSSLVSGCPKLKELHYCLEHKDKAFIPMFWTPSFWMKRRPGLLITEGNCEGNKWHDVRTKFMGL